MVTSACLLQIGVSVLVWHFSSTTFLSVIAEVCLNKLKKDILLLIEDKCV